MLTRDPKLIPAAVVISLLTAATATGCAHKVPTAYATVATTDDDYAKIQRCAGECESDACLASCGLAPYKRVSCAELSVDLPRFVCIDRHHKEVGAAAQQSRAMAGGLVLAPLYVIGTVVCLVILIAIAGGGAGP